jgi:xylulokinase
VAVVRSGEVAEESVLGIDIGTSSTKAVLARPDGTVIAESQRPHALSLPRPGWAEHDAEAVWWEDVLAVCRELVPAAGGGLSGICVSGIGPCVVPCDPMLRPLRPAILYGIDTRATAEIEELEQELGSNAILERGGSALSSQALGPKLLWLRRHEPALWEQADAWYMASSFVVARLTGAYVLDHHSASQCNPLYDLEAAGWASDWVDLVAPGIRFPELVWPSEQVGVVTAEASRETGLPMGTPVVAGTIDAWAEAVSVGVRRRGDVMLMYGSTMFFIQVGDSPRRQALLWTTQGAERGTRTLAAGMSTAGSLTEWVRTLVGADWLDLLREATQVPAGSGGLLLLPYFAGERTPIYDPLARGVIAGLSLSHGRGHLLRAAYEGTAYGVRQILELFAAAAGSPTRIVSVGGGTESLLWLQVVSDVAGITQEIPRIRVGAAYGDALLAAIGAGLVDATADWTELDRIVEPSDEAAAVYRPLYELYLRLYAETADTVHRLTGPPI